MNDKPHNGVDTVAQYLDEHLSGKVVAIPDSLREEFQLALTAHNVLRQMLDDTTVGGWTGGFDRLPPNVADRFEIERELGRGGMGVVYLARQRSLNRRVAIKVLRPSGRDSSSLLLRFRDEAQHLARLRHPHIVSIHEVGEADGEPFFTMDYIEGEPLSAEIARGAMSPTRAVSLIKQVAAAIQHAHQQGIVHRDLKPANVLIDSTGHVFVTDFGLARNLSSDSNLTQSNEMLGTPQYMSPEQARGQTDMIGEATDIHALGLLLFEMLTSRPAYTALSPADVLVKLLNDEPPSLRASDRRIPRDLETICLKTLQKKPSGRYANVSALLEDLRRFENGEPLIARRTSPWMRSMRWAARHWRIATAIIVTAAIMAFLTPRLFDKSFDELLAWGNEELQAGRPQVAAQIFQRAYARGGSGQQDVAMAAIADAIAQIDDTLVAVDLALRAVETNPRLSFGKHDYLVAQSLVLAARKRMPNEVFEPLHGVRLDAAAQSACQLAAERLTIFLDGPWGSADERAEAERWLTAIQNLAREQFPLERWSPDQLANLPTGTLAELDKRARDRQLSPWDRGRAAMAAGRKLEADGNHREALVRFREALAAMRTVFPFVSGVSSDSQSNYFMGRESHAPECRLLSELLADLRRLDPEFDDEAQGGIRFLVHDAESLGDLKLGAMIELFDPNLEDPNRNLPVHLSRYVYIDPQQPKTVQVLDGHYRLRLVGTARPWIPVGGVDPELLEIVAEGWPETIDIRGDWVELPPLAIRRLEPIELLKPAELTRVDLSGLQLAWSPVAGAAKYQVQIGHFIDMPGPQSFWYATIETTSPNLVINQLSGAQRSAVQTHWQFGRIAGFRVQAVDADGKRLAVSQSERRFLIGQELSH